MRVESLAVYHPHSLPARLRADDMSIVASYRTAVAKSHSPVVTLCKQEKTHNFTRVLAQSDFSESLSNAPPVPSNVFTPAVYLLWQDAHTTECTKYF